MLEALAVIGFFTAAYISFHMYFTWAYFEPMVPTAFPNNRSIRFESVICTVLIFVHLMAFHAGASLLSSAAFWVCAGSVIGHGILPPTHQSSTGNILQRLFLEFWKGRVSGIAIGMIVTGFTWLIMPKEDKAAWGALLPLVSALYCIAFVSAFKAITAFGMRDRNDPILAEIGTIFRTNSIIFVGIIGYLSVTFFLVQSPVADSPEVRGVSDLALVIAFFVGAALRI